MSVSPGDVVYVPAGVPHAIGPGMLIAELQEPTDFSILCEWRGFPVRPEDSHLGLGWETARRALDLRVHEPVLELPPESRSFFGADDVLEAAGRFAILLVLEGRGDDRRRSGAPRAARSPCPQPSSRSRSRASCACCAASRRTRP